MSCIGGLAALVWIELGVNAKNSRAKLSQAEPS